MKLRRFSALAAVVTMLVWAAPEVAADPVAPPVPGTAEPAGQTIVPLVDLGAPDSVSMVVNRNIAGSSLTFPVPTGMTPVTLKAGLELPVNLRFGNLVVSQGDRTIARLALPAPDQPQALDIPLAGVQAFGDWVDLKLTVNVIALEDYCWDRMSPVRLVNGAIAFAGTETPPATVAAFLGPVMRKVSIAIPANPSKSESAAAVQVAAAVANRNGQRPEVAVVALPEGASSLPVPAAPLERQIIVKEGGQKGLTLQGGPGIPDLLISGAGDDLTGQAELLADRSLSLAAGPAAVAGSLPEQQSAADNTTLEDLVGSGLTAEELWPTITLAIDQTRWGHPIRDVSIHLLGSHTPLPVDYGAEVTVTVGDDTVDRWPADASGTIDRTVVIPERLLKRQVPVSIGVRSTGSLSTCGGHLPIMLRLDGATSIELERADPPVPQGFQSLPQALMPRIRFGIGTDVFGDTVRAAQIMVGLQRSSLQPLLAEVTDLQDAITTKDPAVLIASGGWDNNALTLPFSTEPGSLTVTGLDGQGQSVTLNLDQAMPFASLQTVFDGNRTVLVATSTGAPGLLDELLGYLVNTPGRWSSLDGRAILSSPGAAPITVPNPPVDYSAKPKDSSSGGGWFWWAVGGIAVLAMVGAVGILLRARST